MDDLIPNIGLSIGHDEQEERVEAEEKAKFQAAQPLFEDILAWFDQEIAACDTFENIDFHHPQLAVETQMMAYKLLAEKLQSERDALRIIANEHLS